jgi:threonyl-tRNA synthetase
MKIPYILVLGDKEEKEGTISVRDKSKVSAMKKEDLIKKLLKEIKERI